MKEACPMRRSPPNDVIASLGLPTMTIRSDPPVVDLDIVTPLPDLELGGPVGLADGRTILLPAVPLPEPECVKGDFAQRRLDLQRTAYHLRLAERGPLRGVVANGRLVAFAGPRPLVHPVDLAVLRASGLDVDAAMSAFRDAIIWHVEHFEPTPHAYPQGFFTTIPENRLTAVADIDGAMYSDGELSLRATMPDIVLSALVGRPLSELVDLPTLRVLDPVIQSAERRDGPLEPTPRILVGLCDPALWRPMP
jgi:hypothetical protein